jgi:hypothetical protein
LAFRYLSSAEDTFSGRDNTSDVQRRSPYEAPCALNPLVYVVLLTTEKSLTDLLILGLTSVIALTIGHPEEPVVNVETGAIFPTAAYQWLRATNASDPSMYRHHGIADVMADVMPNGRECISLFVHRLGNKSLLHAQALYDKSGIPISIRRARSPDQDGKPVDGEHASRISEERLRAGRGEEKGVRKEEGRRTEGVVCGEGGHGGGTNVQSGRPTLGSELPRKVHRSYCSRISTSPPPVYPPSTTARQQQFPACTVKVDVSRALTFRSH